MTRGDTRMRSVARSIRSANTQSATCGTVTVVEDEPDEPTDPDPPDDPDDGLSTAQLAALGGGALGVGLAIARARSR